MTTRFNKKKPGENEFSPGLETFTPFLVEFPYTNCIIKWLVGYFANYNGKCRYIIKAPSSLKGIEGAI